MCQKKKSKGSKPKIDKARFTMWLTARKLGVALGVCDCKAQIVLSSKGGKNFEVDIPKDDDFYGGSRKRFVNYQTIEKKPREYKYLRCNKRAKNGEKSKSSCCNYAIIHRFVDDKFCLKNGKDWIYVKCFETGSIVKNKNVAIDWSAPYDSPIQGMVQGPIQLEGAEIAEENEKRNNEANIFAPPRNTSSRKDSENSNMCPPLPISEYNPPSRRMRKKPKGVFRRRKPAPTQYRHEYFQPPPTPYRANRRQLMPTMQFQMNFKIHQNFGAIPRPPPQQTRYTTQVVGLKRKRGEESEEARWRRRKLFKVSTSPKTESPSEDLTISPMNVAKEQQEFSFPQSSIPNGLDLVKEGFEENMEDLFLALDKVEYEGETGSSLGSQIGEEDQRSTTRPDEDDGFGFCFSGEVEVEFEEPFCYTSMLDNRSF